MLDRLIQQTVAQALMLLWEHTFSEHSYGFRPGRSARMAIEQARKHVEDGYTHVVDIDLSKFFASERMSGNSGSCPARE